MIELYPKIDGLRFKMRYCGGMEWIKFQHEVESC